jgi:hypothetical protein
MRTFDIRPYLGALPITFGMRRPEVHALLGPPRTTHPPNPWRGIGDWWEGANPSISYDGAETVVHIGFSPGDFSLLLSGSPLWSPSGHPDPNPSLLRLDPDPVEVHGFLVFNRIGVTTSGYHNDDENDLAITVYPRGAWDEPLANGTVPDLGRYIRVT